TEPIVYLPLPLHDALPILTFFPHPRMVLQQNSEIKLLNTIEEKQQLLEQIGLDTLIIHPFDKSFSELSAEEFVKNILIEKLNIRSEEHTSELQSREKLVCR